MRGSLESGDQQFNIETDAEHIRAWVVSSSGRRLAGAVFENDGPGDRCLVVGTWNAGDPVALAAFSSGDAAAYLNHDDWPAGLWSITVLADTPQRALRVAAEEARARLVAPKLTTPEGWTWGGDRASA